MYLRPRTAIPPAALISSAARLKPFIWNFPGGAIGPVSEVTMPTATLSWAKAAAAKHAASKAMKRMDVLLVDLVDAQRVVAQQLALGLVAQAERLELVARTAEIEYRVVGAEDHLVLPVGVDVLHEARRPVLRAVRITADVHVRVFPGHGDHLVGPGDADVDADEPQLREVARHRVERDRPA